MRRPLRHGLLVMAIVLLGAWALLRLGDLPWLRIDWTHPVAWLAGAETDQALAALARLAGLALTAWVAITSLLYLIARLAGIRPASVQWLSIGPIRRAVDALLAGSLLLGTVAPSLPAQARTPQTTSTSAPAESVLPHYIPFPAGEVYPVPAENQSTTSPPGSPPDASPPTPGPLPPVPGTTSQPEPTTVEVRPGDNLWKLAARHLERAGYEAGSAEQIAPYWRIVVEANRDRVRSGNPDLIYPGEEILLPRISSEN